MQLPWCRNPGSLASVGRTAEPAATSASTASAANQTSAGQSTSVVPAPCNSQKTPRVSLHNAASDSLAHRANRLGERMGWVGGGLGRGLANQARPVVYTTGVVCFESFRRCERFCHLPRDNGGRQFSKCTTGTGVLASRGKDGAGVGGGGTSGRSRLDRNRRASVVGKEETTRQQSQQLSAPVSNWYCPSAAHIHWLSSDQ